VGPLAVEEWIGSDEQRLSPLLTGAGDSASTLALRMSNGSPAACIAAAISCASWLSAMFSEFTNMAILVALGTISRSSSRRFGTSSEVYVLTPVTLPPGRLKVLTSPSPTGSAPPIKRMGIVVVAAFAASAVRVPPVAAITVT
jgi:hypothetical protein